MLGIKVVVRGDCVICNKPIDDDGIFLCSNCRRLNNIYQEEQKNVGKISLSDLLADCGDKRIEKAIKEERLIKKLQELVCLRQKAGSVKYESKNKESMNALIEIHRIDELIVENVIRFFIEEYDA